DAERFERYTSGFKSNVTLSVAESAVTIFFPPMSVTVAELFTVCPPPESPAMINEVNDPEHTPFELVQTLPPPSARILPVTSRRPAMVDVPDPKTLIRFHVDVPVIKDCPATESVRPGVVVPMPRDEYPKILPVACTVDDA